MIVGKYMKKKTIRIETFENANGYTARVEGDVEARIFGDVKHYVSSTHAARVVAGYALGLTYDGDAHTVRAKHVGAGVYVCSLFKHV